MAISLCAVSSPATEPAGVNIAESGRPLDPQTWQARHDMIGAHLEDEVAHEEWIQTVEYDASVPRWYVRFGCEGRDAATIYFDLHQRTLRYEVYFLPDPPGHREELYRFCLQRNHNAYGAHFSIGPDGDLYLVGRVLLEHLDVAELDRIIGACYELVERWFQPAIRIGYRRD
jgi:Putative bacterial sensory transduction regulator